MPIFKLETIMNALELAIQEAFNHPEEPPITNKVYLEFIKANFIVPIERTSAEDAPEVLFFQENNQLFLPVFTEMAHLDQWATEISDRIKLLKLSGVDLLKGIGDDVTVCLDIGARTYKEFNPAELARMRSMVLKLFKN